MDDLANATMPSTRTTRALAQCHAEIAPVKTSGAQAPRRSNTANEGGQSEGTCGGRLEKISRLAQPANSLRDPKGIRRGHVTKEFLQAGYEPYIMGPEELGRYVKSENVKWAKIIQAAHITGE
jgi:hypothetical protein